MQHQKLATQGTAPGRTVEGAGRGLLRAVFHDIDTFNEAVEG